MMVERSLHALWTVRWLDALAGGAADYGLYLCFAFLIVAWLRKRPSGVLLPFALGAAAATLAVWAAGSSFQEQRPFVALGVTPLVPHGADNGFPSDHSAAAAYAAVFAAMIDPAAGAFACMLAAAVGIGRLYCLLHYPVDVVAGWTLGTMSALAAGLYWKRRSA